jgi:uncharacterized protein YfaQ (DUF2300 family)
MSKLFSRAISRQKMSYQNDDYHFSRRVWRKTRHQAANPAQASDITSYRIWSF